MSAYGLKRIETGTPEGDKFGFTEGLFSGWLEFDEVMNRIYLHYIISKKKNEGNTQKLILSWLKSGYEVRVVMPKEIMRHILMKKELQKAGKFFFVYEFFPEQYTDPVIVAASQKRIPIPIRECFCPYIDGPEICGRSRIHAQHYHCESPWSEGRSDCPIIRYRGDI